jgi:hypothetical protein
MGEHQSRLGTTTLPTVFSLTLLLVSVLIIGFIPAMECEDCTGSGQIYPLSCFARPDEIESFPCYICNGRGRMTLWKKIAREAARLKYRWEYRDQFRRLGV